jgi:hypothetical protein
MPSINLEQFLRRSLLALALTWALPGHAWEEGDQETCPARGRYVNAYGFSVTLPDGLKGCPNSPVGMSDHGVEIPLDPQRQRVIDVFASYNVLLHETVAEAVTDDLDSFRENAELTAVKLVSRTSFRLGGLAAERLVLRYRVKATGMEMISDSSSALRSVIKASAEPSHAYRVSLTTPANRYAADRLVLEQILASWRQSATDDDPLRHHPRRAIKPANEVKQR